MKHMVDGKIVVACCDGMIEFDDVKKYMDQDILDSLLERYSPKDEEALAHLYRMEYETMHGIEWKGYWQDAKYQFWDPRIVEIDD